MNIALVLSGGTGTRLGSDIPKQYIEVGGRPVISYCLERLFGCTGIHAVHIVADEAWRGVVEESMRCIKGAAGSSLAKGSQPQDKQSENPAHEVGIPEKFRGFSEPGANRQLSILNGLEDIRTYAADADYVLIHDAARPVLSERQVMECLCAVQGHDGVVPVLPMKDTVYASADKHTISSLLDRGSIFAGQAPELFQIGRYYRAVTRLMPERILGINGSAEPAVMAGLDIVMIPGDEANFKITTREDLVSFRRIVQEKGVSSTL